MWDIDRAPKLYIAAFMQGTKTKEFLVLSFLALCKSKEDKVQYIQN